MPSKTTSPPQIHIRGARTHNLKNISLSIPRDALVVLTGLSGSGKSSLAFDTLYAEGQRRYVESLSAYARQFLSLMPKPDVDAIDGLSPAIAIDQKSTSHNPRSTVGTITEIYDYLRLLYARIGAPQCPTHQLTLDAQSISQMVDGIMQMPAGHRVIILAPLIEHRKGEHRPVFEQLRQQGYVRVRIDQVIYELDDLPTLNKQTHHTIEAVIDRLKIRDDLTQRLAESCETALSLSDGIVRVLDLDTEHTQDFSNRFACPQCGFSLTELQPRFFSFNNPAGACDSCDGLGVSEFFDPKKIITDTELSISSGAIRGWDRRHFFYFQLLEALAKHDGFDLTQPFQSYSEKTQQRILYGTEEAITVTISSPTGRSIKRKQPFEGVIPNMQRRYNESEASSIREELSKCLSIANCKICDGERLNVAARHVHINQLRLPQLCQLPITDALTQLNDLTLSPQQATIADKILREIKSRLEFLINVGLNYLSISRQADSLSGGEAQRIRLASQIGSGLTGVMYVLDEPSIGLHQRDNERLLNTLKHLRDLGNTVIVVEHDEDAIRHADYVIDIGPAAGKNGGEVVFAGDVSSLLHDKNSITAQYLNGTKQIAVPQKRRQRNPNEMLHIHNAHCHNLQHINVDIPLGLTTCITGVSGSGKSSLINRTLLPLAAATLNGARLPDQLQVDHIDGLGHLDKVIAIDQSPIGRTPRSNPATYTGVFTPIRELFTASKMARTRGYRAGRFSFNVKGGRCEACEGDGVIRVEMHFLPDVYVTCDTCKGQRYNRETLEITYKGKNIHQVLSMTVAEGAEFFDAIPAIRRKLTTLVEVGLSYISLGQSATTLSGGEAQRIKLAKELSRRDTGHTLYVLDEPTTGLHFHDVAQLLHVLDKLRDKGNSIVLIEHHLDVIKTADWVIDLGPEGGAGGGQIIAQGTPEQLAQHKTSYTGQFLKALLAKHQASQSS